MVVSGDSRIAWTGQSTIAMAATCNIALLGMFKRRSSKGINPTMAGIIGVFQIVWIYYGLLIASRPVIAWNMIGVVINLLTVGAYVRFARRENPATV